jgi:hypothetical protein
MKIVFKAETFEGIKIQISEFMSNHLKSDETPKVKRPRTPKSKEGKEEVTPLELEEATPPVEEEKPVVNVTEKPVVKITKEQLVEMLQKVNKAKGLPKAREVLAKFSCTRLGELPEEKYGDFYLACRDEIL